LDWFAAAISFVRARLQSSKTPLPYKYFWPSMKSASEESGKSAGSGAGAAARTSRRGLFAGVTVGLESLASGLSSASVEGAASAVFSSGLFSFVPSAGEAGALLSGGVVASGWGLDAAGVEEDGVGVASGDGAVAAVSPDVLDMLASGMTEDEILHDYPYLEKADFPAVYAYASQRGRERVSR